MCGIWVGTLVTTNSRLEKAIKSSVRELGVIEGLSRMSAKVSCPVLRGGESGDARTSPDNHGNQSAHN